MMGFEPTTLGTTIRCSNLLSYIHQARAHKSIRPERGVGTRYGGLVAPARIPRRGALGRRMLRAWARSMSEYDVTTAIGSAMRRGAYGKPEGSVRSRSRWAANDVASSPPGS